MRRHPVSAVLALLATASTCFAQLPTPTTQDPVLDTRPQPGADVIVRPAEKPLVSGWLRLDNYQTERLGRYAATGLVRLHNPAGFGDLATGQFRSTVTGELIEGALSYNVPVNDAGTRIGVIAGVGHQDRGIPATGDGEGDYTRASVVGTHPFLRADDRNLHADLSFNRYRFQDDFEVARFDTTAVHRFATARLRASSVDRLLGGGRMAAYIEVQAGDIDFDRASDPLQFDGHFVRRRVRFERIQTVTPGSALSMSIFAQDASRNLPSQRSFGLTGPHGVRAYPQSELQPDEGYFARVDYDVRLPVPGAWTATGGVFWDTGHGKLNRNPLPGALNNERTLSGVGTKFLLGQPGKFDTSFTIAWPTAGPSRSRDRDPQIWLTATAYF